MVITVIDIIILIMLVYFVIGGYSKGFIKQTSTIIGIIFALVIAMNYYYVFITVIEPYLQVSPAMLQFISFAILFIVINIFVHLLGYICKKILDALFLKPVDHAAGAALGLIKGFVVSYLLVLMLSHVPYLSLNEHINDSILADRILGMTPFLQNSLQNIFKS